MSSCLICACLQSVQLEKLPLSGLVEAILYYQILVIHILNCLFAIMFILFMLVISLCPLNDKHLIHDNSMLHQKFNTNRQDGSRQCYCHHRPLIIVISYFMGDEGYGYI